MFPVYGYPVQHAVGDYDVLAEEYESRAAYARLMAARQAAAARHLSPYELDPYAQYEQPYMPRRYAPRPRPNYYPRPRSHPSVVAAPAYHRASPYDEALWPCEEPEFYDHPVQPYPHHPQSVPEVTRYRHRHVPPVTARPQRHAESDDPPLLEPVARQQQQASVTVEDLGRYLQTVLGAIPTPDRPSQRSETIRHQQAQAEERRVREAQALIAREQRRRQQEKEEENHVRQQLQALFSFTPRLDPRSASRTTAHETAIPASLPAQQPAQRVRMATDDLGRFARDLSASGPQGQQSDISDLLQQVLAATLGTGASTVSPQAGTTAVTSPVASSSTAPAKYTYAAPASAQLSEHRGASSSGLPAPEEQRRSDAAIEAQQIIHAIRASLDPANDVKPPQPSGVAPTSASVPSAPVSDRGRAEKGKEPVRVPLRSPSPQIHTIESIEAEFVNLSYDFRFPAHVDFAPLPSPPATLAYTQENASVRAYEHALNGLLTKVDAIETLGVAEVRTARKELVKRIEGALEKLDEEKAEAWRKQSGNVQDVDVGVEVKGYDVESIETAAESTATKSVPVDQDPIPTTPDTLVADIDPAPEDSVSPQTSGTSVETIEPTASRSYPPAALLSDPLALSTPSTPPAESDTSSSMRVPSPRTDPETAEFVML